MQLRKRDRILVNIEKKIRQKFVYFLCACLLHLLVTTTESILPIVKPEIDYTLDSPKNGYKLAYMCMQNSCSRGISETPNFGAEVSINKMFCFEGSIIIKLNTPMLLQQLYASVKYS